MMKLTGLALAIVASACSQRVYSPPTQAFALEPIATLQPGQHAADVEASRQAAIFDPDLDAGALRLRTGIGPDTEVSLEGTAFAVEDAGPSTAVRSFYTGRAGVRTNPGHGPFSLSAGAGGGYSPSGGAFAAFDAGIGVGYQNCVLVPLARASLFASTPLDPQPIDVSVDSDAPPVYATPRRTVGGQVRLGLRLSLDPGACRRGEPGTWLSAGVGLTSLYDGQSSDDIGGFGVGLSIPL